jgi:hypothetical protein
MINNLPNYHKLFYTSWWSFPLGGSDMQRINISEVYRFGQVIHPLTELEGGKPLKNYHFSLMMGRIWLNWFIADNMIPMIICKEAASKVVSGIDQLLPENPQTNEVADLEKEISYPDLYPIISSAQQFETIFSAEVQNMATYFVSKKGIYDTNDLITRADDIFTENVKRYISEEAKTDIREAGKCLAFDLATAAGYHSARAVERVLIDYLTLKCPDAISKMKDSEHNLGGYIKLARTEECDEKICGSLDQFRDLHRNPLMHPQAVLTVDEALTLLGIAQSAIVAMATEIKKIKLPPEDDDLIPVPSK